MVSSLLGRDAESALADAVLFGRENGVVFAGPHGVGRSALLDAIAERAREIGMTTHRIHGSPALTDVPFGAASHLLADDDTPHRQSTIRRAERRLSSSDGSAGSVVIVDDAHDLDTASIGLLHAFAVGRRVRLVLALIDGPSVPPSLTRLWKDTHLVRHELEPLSRPSARTLVERQLDGPVADDVERTTWELTQGLPLFVTLICESGRFVRVGNLLHLDGDPTDAPRVNAAVQSLLGRLSSGALMSLAALSTAGELETELLDAVAGSEATSELERQRLVVRTEVGLAASPPICARVAHHTMTTHGRRQMNASLATAMWQRPDLAGHDLVRAVGWTLDANQPCDADVMTLAAKHALASGDFATAEAIGTAAMAQLASPANWEPAFVVAQAQRQLGKGMRAEPAFEIASEAPLAADRVKVGIARAHNLAIGCGRFAEALSHLEDLSNSVDAPAFARQLAAERTFISAVIGDFRTVTRTAGVVLDDPDLDEFTAVTVANGLAFASVMLLDLDRFDRDLPRFRAGAERLETVYPLAVDQCDLVTAVARVAQGRIDDAVDLCAVRREHGMDAAWGAGDGAWATIETFARSFRVDTTIEDVARRAAVGLQSLDPLGMRHVGTGLVAVALIHCGAVDEANRVYAQVCPPTGEGDRRSSRLIQARLTAWQVAGAGDTRRAADLVCEGADTAIEYGQVLWGMLGLHDAVRFGHGETANDMLIAVRSSGYTDASPLLDAICRHAGAVADTDPVAMLTAANEFIQIGATRLAAEAAAQAGQVFTDRRQHRDAGRALARAQLIGGGRLPTTPAGRTLTPALTDRQAEIVGALLRGATAREVADRLSLSVRTIENHIAAVYRSLDVSSRPELADALDIRIDPSHPFE